ncbi:MAG TPA: plastocyanin/azurin family copper-binding protein [Gaiellaceae bacterium]
MLFALSTSHKIGLGLTGAVFIAFALASSFLLPRYRPDYPGRGLRWFILAALALFVGMMFAVEFFGREPAEATANEKTTSASTTGTATTSTSGGAKKIAVGEKEFKIELPSTSLSAGAYEFDLKNDGKIPHDLTIDGPGVAKAHTPTIKGGASATLKVTLQKGDYDFYCSVPGHKQLGMDVKVTVS